MGGVGSGWPGLGGTWVLRDMVRSGCMDGKGVGARLSREGHCGRWLGHHLHAWRNIGGSGFCGTFQSSLLGGRPVRLSRTKLGAGNAGAPEELPDVTVVSTAPAGCVPSAVLQGGGRGAQINPSPTVCREAQKRPPQGSWFFHLPGILLWPRERTPTCHRQTWGHRLCRKPFMATETSMACSERRMHCPSGKHLMRRTSQDSI